MIVCGFELRFPVAIRWPLRPARPFYCDRCNRYQDSLGKGRCARCLGPVRMVRPL